MSEQHHYFYDCNHLSDGTVESIACCDCGWQSEPVAGAAAYDRVKVAYRLHIEDALGEMAYYSAPVLCLNCAFGGPANLLVGQDVWSGVCPVCGASGRLRPDNPAIEEEHERTKRWRF